MNNFSLHILSGNSYNDIRFSSVLAQKMYLKYCSSKDTKEGIENILKYMSYEEMFERRYKDDTLLIASKNKDKIVGILEMTRVNHVSLLFVDDNFFKNKIATELFDFMKTIIKSKSYTVNSSEYAVNFYQKIGFRKLSEYAECTDGVMFYPMIYSDDNLSFLNIT